MAVGGGLEPPTFRLTAGRCTSSTTPQRARPSYRRKKRDHPGGQRLRNRPQRPADLLGPVALREVGQHDRFVLETVGALEDVVEVDVRVLPRPRRRPPEGRTSTRAAGPSRAEDLGAASKISSPQSPGYARSGISSRRVTVAPLRRRAAISSPPRPASSSRSLCRTSEKRYPTVGTRWRPGSTVSSRSLRSAMRSPGLRRDDLGLVVDVLQPLAGRDPGLRRPGRPPPGRRRAPAEAPRAAAARRDARGRPCDRDARARRRRRRSRRVLRRAAELEQRPEASAACRRIRGPRSRRPRSGCPRPRSRRGRGRAG